MLPPDEAVRSLTELDRLPLSELLRLAGGDQPCATVPHRLAWRIGVALHRNGRYRAAAHWLDIAESAADAASNEEAALGLAGVASTAWALGRLDRARDLADRAVKIADTDRALAAAWIAEALVCASDGDRPSNRERYRRALCHAEAAGDLPAQARIHNNLGSGFNEEARPTEAIAALERAIELGEAGGDAAITAFARFNVAESLRMLGRHEESVDNLERALAWWHAADSQLVGMGLLGLADTQAARGYASQAEAAYRRAAEAAEDSGDAQVLVPALAGWARCRLTDEAPEARALVRRALAAPVALGRVPALLAAGWVALGSGDAAEAVRHGRSAEREAATRTDRAGLAEALELMAIASSRIDGRGDTTRLAEAEALWNQSGNPVRQATHRVVAARLGNDPVAERAARAELRRLGVRDDGRRIAGPLAALGAPAAPALTIRTLGRFTVLRGDETLSGSAWQSRKARDLLKVLAGRRGEPVSRDALVEALWPDVGEPGPRLSVLLSTLRAVLDPDKRHPPHHFVVADRSAVRLDLLSVDIDAVEFVGAAERALTARRAGQPDAVAQLEHAVSLYAGDYLESEPYEVWIGDVRDELLGLSQRVRRQLARALLEAGDAERAVDWLVGLVAADRYDESAHRDLIRTLAGLRRHGEVRRRYARYAAAMTELDVPVTPLADLIAPRVQD